MKGLARDWKSDKNSNNSINRDFLNELIIQSAYNRSFTMIVTVITLFTNWATSSLVRFLIVTLTIGFIIQDAMKRARKYQEFRARINKLPGPPAVNPMIGNIPSKVLGMMHSCSRKEASDFYTSQIQSVLGHTIIYKDEPLYRLWVGNQPVICVWKPEAVEQILSDNFLLEKSYHYDFLRPWLGDGLLTSPGRIWRPRRKLLVPSFHFHILQDFVPIFDRKSRLLVTRLNNMIADLKQAPSSLSGRVEQTEKTTSVVVDITPIITACALDAICETIMGVSIDAQNNPKNEYCQSVYIVGETFLERIIQPRYWLDPIFKLTDLGRLYAHHLGKLHHFTRKVISDRKFERLKRSENLSADSFREQNSSSSSDEPTEKDHPTGTTSQHLPTKIDTNERKQPKAFLDLLLDKLNLSGGQTLTDEEIREEVDTFMFEGHDTTAMALSWALFLLGHHQEIQKRLQEEVDQYFDNNSTASGKDEQVQLDEIKKLKYLDCVVKEALRLCPSVPFIGRQTTKDMEIQGYDVPAGSVIFVLIYQLHRNREIFPEPERFNPDRFLDVHTNRRHPFAYVPFSAGPRNCIGQKFAKAEMKTILLHLMRNFTFESVTDLDKAKVQMEMVLRPKNALEMRVSVREKAF